MDGKGWCAWRTIAEATNKLRVHQQPTPTPHFTPYPQAASGLVDAELADVHEAALNEKTAVNWDFEAGER